MPDGTEQIVTFPEVGDWVVSAEFGVRVRASAEYLVLEDHWVPCEIELLSGGDGEPEFYVRTEVTAAGPKLVELRLSSTDPGARGIRQADLRSVQIGAFVEDLVAAFTIRVERTNDGQVAAAHPSLHGSPQWQDSLRFVGQLRAGRTSRDITPQLLERVATVYRDNIDRYPTKAVQHHFQVSQRMAAEYVSRARRRGLLPPTKRGKKQA